MDKKWLSLFLLLFVIVLSGCAESNSASLPTGLFMPKTDVNPSALCSISLTDVKVVSTAGSPSLVLQGTVGSYCGQVEMKMMPQVETDTVRIIVVAETPKDAPTSTELKATKPVYINMTLETLPKGRYKLFVNGTQYQTFSTQ